MNQDDSELEHYLRGDSEISREYRRLKSPPLPETVDGRMLQAARQGTAENSASEDGSAERRRAPRASTRRPPWFAPFALVASIILSVALVMAVVMQPARQHRAEEAPHWVYASTRTADRLDLRVEKPAAAPRADGRARPQDAQSWLMRIHELRREGRHLEADAEYRRFKAVFPDYARDDGDEAAH